MFKKTEQLATLYQSLATLLDAGFDLIRGLETVNGQKSPFNKELTWFIQFVKRGNPLSTAMARYPRLFSELDRSLIKSSEASGNLAEIFKYLAQWHELKYNLWRRILSGLVYPGIMFHAGAVILPLPLAFLQSIPAYLVSVFSFLAIFYVPFTIGVILSKVGYRYVAVKYGIDTFLLGLPMIAGVIENIVYGRYCLVFFMLYRAGIPIDRCIDLAARSCGNKVIEQHFLTAIDSVLQGMPASAGFSDKIPYELSAIWKIGEESGTLDVSLEKLYRKYFDTAEIKIKVLSENLPRFIYIVMVLYMAYRIVVGMQLIMNTLNKTLLQ